MRQPPGTLARYTTAARINHWITAACLILLALSGMALFHPSLFFLTALFGGGVYARQIHPWFGSVLLISFALLFIRFARYNLWNRDDTRWMGAIGRVLANDEEHVPECGRYNAGQKLVFWLMTLLILVLFLSGLVIWDTYFFSYTTILDKRIAQLLHSLAAVIITGVWIIHVYAALWVRGTIPAMTRGIVSAGWSWRHHRKWLREAAKRPTDPHGAA
jgi:formate dehydrogenase subunit gamma